MTDEYLAGSLRSPMLGVAISQHGNSFEKSEAQVFEMIAILGGHFSSDLHTNIDASDFKSKTLSSFCSCP